VGGIAKLHHTVPQFYLRGFADTSERIITVKLPGDKRYTQVVKKAAATNHFYSIDGHPQGSDVFEKSLSEMEAAAAAAFDAIERGAWPLSEEQRDDLATFMAVQRVRGPDHRRTMGYLAATMTQLEVQVTGRENIQQWVKDRYAVEVDDDEAEEVWKQATQPGGRRSPSLPKNTSPSWSNWLRKSCPLSWAGRGPSSDSDAVRWSPPTGLLVCCNTRRMSRREVWGF
jgi:hypothetical protein